MRTFSQSLRQHPRPSSPDRLMSLRYVAGCNAMQVAKAMHTKLDEAKALPNGCFCCRCRCCALCVRGVSLFVCVCFVRAMPSQTCFVVGRGVSCQSCSELPRYAANSTPYHLACLPCIRRLHVGLCEGRALVLIPPTSSDKFCLVQLPRVLRARLRGWQES